MSTDISPDVLAKMHEEPKRLWLEALRSDEYEQGYGYLHVDDEDGERYCCLGVLCEVAKKAGVPVERTRRSLGTYGYDGDSVMPPAIVTNWAFGDETQGQFRFAVIVDGRLRTLDTLNDDDRLTFEQIADLIEEQL